MCHNCQGFAETVRINHPHELHDLAKQISDCLAKGVFSFVGGNCSIDEVATGANWPADYVEWFLACNSCGQKFHLHVETYHGAGGRWELVSPK